LQFPFQAASQETFGYPLVFFPFGRSENYKKYRSFLYFLITIVTLNTLKTLRRRVASQNTLGELRLLLNSLGIQGMLETRDMKQTKSSSNSGTRVSCPPKGKGRAPLFNLIAPSQYAIRRKRRKIR